MTFVEFKDKGFENEIKRALDISSENLNIEDLAAIKGIKVSGRKMSGTPVFWESEHSALNMSRPNFSFDINKSENGQWQSDLVHFSHIKSLHLYVENTDLGYLKNFSNLKELYVEHSETTDWGFIPHLIKLRYLYINECHFPDLTPIKQLAELQIDVFNQLVEEKGILNVFFGGLTNLMLNDCSVIDVSPLAACKYVSELNLSHNQISDISPLAEINHLYYLTLKHNKIKDLSPLKKRKGLYYINCEHNNISDISVFKSFSESNLSRLYLGDNPIEDFTPLKGLRLIRHDIKTL